MHTFEIHDVRPDGRGPRFRPGTPEKSWDHLLFAHSREKTPTGAVLLGCSRTKVLPDHSGNALIDAVGYAYNYHYPLSLSPAAIWMAIGHGLSCWINENAEKVRRQFVAHEGKVKIQIEVPAAPHWPSVLDEFSEQIASHIGKKRDLFVSSFSTATPDEKAASEVMLMHSMSKYLDYGMVTLCGFPRITLEGSVQDWEVIYDRVRNFGELGAVAGDEHMKAWVDALLPILEEFAHSAKGNPDKDFWNGFYKYDGGSGGPYVSGHIINFFPYLTNGTNLYRNPGLGGVQRKIAPSKFDRGLSRVDVDWNRLGEKLKVEFYGGFVGVSVAEDSTLRPECGWGILDVTNRRT